ncbi:methionine aminopeptidase 1-like [Oppia nitens]|uniref:methionine aminopeptidase 1-like n=1 Tax=Oppia nitens TaxID=1686743 RepID=UPI0023DB5F51|nr:methionine aminopeptidase 1-like [Oppia nitens]
MNTEAVAKTCIGCSISGSFSLLCPNCLKFGKNDSIFCTQECFKKNWSQHKVIHKTLMTTNNNNNKIAETYNPWPNYDFTGPLRPVYPLSLKRSVAEHIERPDYADHPLGESKCEQSIKGSTHIKVLDDEEIEGVRVAGLLARQVMDVAYSAIAIGVTTDEVDRLVHEACIERDCYPSPLNYYNFPKSCCTSVNEVICHGIPDQRPLEDGDLCNVDITIFHRGFHGDLNETFFVGNVSEEAKRLVKTTWESLQKAIELIKPGEKYREIGNVIQKHVQSQGYSVVKSYCGHGIHRLFHTAPQVPHYAKNKAMGVMKAGHCFTIEPMISEGTWRDECWPDDWTAVTKDGKLSAQFEQTFLVTDTGYEILTRRRSHNGLPYFMD